MKNFSSSDAYDMKSDSLSEQSGLHPFLSKNISSDFSAIISGPRLSLDSNLTRRIFRATSSVNGLTASDVSCVETVLGSHEMKSQSSSPFTARAMSSAASASAAETYS